MIPPSYLLMILLICEKITHAFARDTCLWACWTNSTFSKHGGVQKAHRRERASKLLRPQQFSVGPSVEICVKSGLPLARYNVCTNARCICRGSLGDGELEYESPGSVQKAHQRGRACKLLRPQRFSVGPWVEICAKSGLPLARYNVCTNARCI